MLTESLGGGARFFGNLRQNSGNEDWLLGKKVDKSREMRGGERPLLTQSGYSGSYPMFSYAESIKRIWRFNEKCFRVSVAVTTGLPMRAISKRVPKCIAAWIIAVTNCAFAADNALPSNWSQNEPGGRYIDIRVPVPCEANTFAANVFIDRFNPDPAGRNFPTAKVVVSTRAVTEVNGGLEQTAVLELSSDVNQKIPHAHFSKHSQGTLDHLDLGPIQLGEKAAIELSWDDDGKITASVNGGEKMSVNLLGRPRSMGLVISGANAGFDGIQIRSVGERPSSCRETVAP
ncbi:MAG TPA: hypothetical protein VG892_03360 [Terriglobales bacterium]|nr:hypothetical protein [Terriglobales bacterium]